MCFAGIHRVGSFAWWQRYSEWSLCWCKSRREMSTWLQVTSKYKALAQILVSGHWSARFLPDHCLWLCIAVFFFCRIIITKLFVHWSQTLQSFLYTFSFFIKKGGDKRYSLFFLFRNLSQSFVIYCACGFSSGLTFRRLLPSKCPNLVIVINVWICYDLQYLKMRKSLQDFFLLRPYFTSEQVDRHRKSGTWCLVDSFQPIYWTILTASWLMETFSYFIHDIVLFGKIVTPQLPPKDFPQTQKKTQNAIQ